MVSARKGVGKLDARDRRQEDDGGAGNRLGQEASNQPAELEGNGLSQGGASSLTSCYVARLVMKVLPSDTTTIRSELVCAAPR